MKIFMYKFFRVFTLIIGILATLLGLVALPATIFISICGIFLVFISFKLKPYTIANGKTSESELAQIKEKEQEKIDYYTNLNINDLVIDKPNIMLKNKEIAYYQQNTIVKYFLEKNKTTKTTYGGYRARVKITKGLSYNAGTIKTDSKKELVKELQIQGMIILTNQRVIIKGKNDIKEIKLSSIDDVEVYPDGVRLIRASGSNAILQGFKSAEFSIILLKIKGVLE